MLRALIFDVDGTLAETEELHREAFNQAFAQLQLGWHWDRPTYARLLAVAGGLERMQRHALACWGPAQGAEARRRLQLLTLVHARKNTLYAQAIQDGPLQARPGVLALIEAAPAAGLRLAIATTTSPGNVDVLLTRLLGAHWRARFAAVEDGGSAPAKKPDPQAYRQALQGLGLPAPQCLALEDSDNGLRAACAAGIATVVTPSTYTREHDFRGALRVLPDLQGATPQALAQWLAAAGPDGAAPATPAAKPAASAAPPHSD